MALLITFGGSAEADAASDLSLQRASDGTLLVIGSGWRPGDRLVVNVGPAAFTTYVDGAGDFEVATGLSTYQGDLAVHRLKRVDLPPRPLTPHPLAVLLAQGFAEGAALMGAVVGLGLIAIGVRRWAHSP